MRKIAVAVSIAAFSLFATPTSGSASTTPAEVVANIVDAAEALLAKLDAAEREALLFSFDDQEQRRRWSNLPVGMFPRRGLRMGDLSGQQQDAVMSLLKATLSERGFQQVVDNVQGDEELRRPLDWGRVSFGKDEFFVALLGTPSSTTPWMWQFGGHHLGINATIVGDQITLAPSLTGGEPIHYVRDGQQVRQLAAETDKAFALIHSLSEEQRKKAVLGSSRVDWSYGPKTKNIQAKKEGISASDLDPRQRGLLLALIEERIGILNDTHSEIAMKRISARLRENYFSWFGPTTTGSAAAFRIQGPLAIIEYAPQRVRGNAVNHIHAIYRDPSNEYGMGFSTSK